MKRHVALDMILEFKAHVKNRLFALPDQPDYLAIPQLPSYLHTAFLILVGQQQDELHEDSPDSFSRLALPAKQRFLKTCA
jgi:hypothetical protein